MSFRQTTTYRVTLWILTLACLGGAGYLGYRTFVVPAAPANRLQAAETAFARGTEAFNQKKWGEAATRFDEAQLLCDKGMDELKNLLDGNKLPAEQAQNLQGRLMWVKARAIRDRDYAKSYEEDKPLPTIPDPQYNEHYRNFNAIRDAEARTQARTALRIAAQRLSSDQALAKEILKELLRTELAYNPIDWRFIEPYLRRATELEPQNARAYYYLARYEYEQPGDDGFTPTPLNRRSAERMDRAREYLQSAKQSGAAYWRTVGLEIDILMWPLRTAKERKLKPEVVAAAEKAVDQLLWAPETGLIEVAGRGEKLTNFGVADANGMKSVCEAAFDRASTIARIKPNDIGSMKMVVQAVVNFTNKIADNAELQAYLGQFAPVCVEFVAQSLPFLLKTDLVAWNDYAAAIDKLIERLPEAVKKNSTLALAYARLLAAEAEVAAAANDTTRAKELRVKAHKQLTDGLAAAEQAKAPHSVTDEFHVEIARMAFLLGAKAEEFTVHVTKLKESPSQRAQLWALLIEGQVAENQGRLEKAKAVLQAVATAKGHPDLSFRANVVLAQLNMALADWPASLAAWRDVEARYAYPELPAEAKAWAEERLGGTAGITANVVITNLRTAIDAANKYLRTNPGKPIPATLLAGYEEAAETAAKRLKPPSAQDRTARIALAEYMMATNRRKEAEARVEALTLDYPDSLEVLNLRCRLLALPTEPGGKPNANGIAAADALIRKFLRDYPNDKSARLFLASWYLRTDRAEKAVDYLRDPANFPGGPDPAVERLLAVALFRAGDREKAQEILIAQPPEPLIDAALIEAATTKEQYVQRLKEAAARYEDQNFFRLYQAALDFAEGRYEAAIQGFASVLEVTRIRDTARAGLRRALARYGQAEPLKARDLAIRLTSEFPNDPAVFLAAANAAFLIDDIGSPDDNWDTSKTMYAAANRWEAVAAKAGIPAPEIAVVKTQFRLLAGDIDRAKREAITAQASNPNNPTLMLLVAELSLLPPVNLERAKEFYAAAAKDSPNDPRLPFLEAAILAATGDWAGAAAVYERVIERSPNNSSAYARLVESWTKANKKADALRWVKTWAERLPNDNAARGEWIRLLVEDGQKAEAIKRADELVRERLAQVDKLIADVKPPLPPEQSERLRNEARRDALLAAASGFFRAKAYDEAEVRIREAMKLFPDQIRIAMLLADIAMERKNWDQAITIYNEILKKFPRDLIAGNNLAWILCEVKNQPQSALTVVEEIRKAQGSDRPIGPERLPADFLDTIGTIYAKLKRPERYAEMKSLFTVAAKRYPDDPRMHLYLGIALAHTGERSAALPELETAIRLAKAENSLPEDQKTMVITTAESLRKELQK
ncbi:MAG: tetratricopeptide repeat protein [Gemmataceae bacterium]|nr:tetratricopeptide repeat protein [Gemmata sp.]MDW8199172.1 tetratricopeptide repeat protein [Gemmataceae bacterium]